MSLMIVGLCEWMNRAKRLNRALIDHPVVVAFFVFVTVLPLVLHLGYE